MSEMVERVAKAIYEKWATNRSVPETGAEVSRLGHSIAREARDEARAALEAMLEPTAEMVAAAFPCERDEDFDLSAKKLGAAACLLLGGGKDIGLLEGEAVKQAAFLVRDYRLMIAAATGTQKETL